MNRGIYVASSSPQLPAIYDGRRRLREYSAQDDRIERVLRRSRSMDKVRPLDADCPALVARATRLSALYGASLDSELARKGAGERPGRRRRRRNPRSLPARRQSCGGGNGTPSSSAGGEREPDTLTASRMTRKQKGTLRRALSTAGEVAMRYTVEVSAGMKAYDGPPLGPKDVKDLLLRNLRIRLPLSEATALIAHFTKVRNADRIEHGDFLHAIQRLRRELLVKRKGDRCDKSNQTTTNNRRRQLPPVSSVFGDDGASSAPHLFSSAALLRTTPASVSTSLAPSSSSHVSFKRSGRDHGVAVCDTNSAGKYSANIPVSMGKIVGALAKVEQAASSFDRRRVESLRQVDLSGVTSPHAFGSVLLTHFNVKADPSEQRELVALLKDEKKGTVDAERFRAYFLSLIGEDLETAKRIITTTTATECGGSATNENPTNVHISRAAAFPLFTLDDSLRRLKIEANNNEGGRGGEDGRGEDGRGEDDEGIHTQRHPLAASSRRIERSYNHPNNQQCGGDGKGVRDDSRDDGNSACRGRKMLMRTGAKSTRPTASAAAAVAKASPIEQPRAPPWGVGGGTRGGRCEYGSIR